ncbi:MAG: Rieske 2Fe-2S domain-containing protein [Gemmatimonadales bacterium]|nr:Rieske 2Fe-2S domain-containing protein [Gemmatimonadales bacterium]NIN12086.1 Rieske 2Fe-2S domain-containing protein [Gemmatimonadales bacterium]NIR03321.1 Rieske 2Fe-2S domain-containing protein [Gemmatimonadales bacterium]NIS67001.1 Rieske 2Fe-2S domain-containing protein [Gemmatimonadales bacterium]
MVAEQPRGSNRSRRGFLNRLLGTSVGGLVLAALYPAIRYVIPPGAGESTAAAVTLSLKPQEVAPNTGQLFKFGSRPGILIRTPSGELRAFSAVCTHLGCIVQYRADLGHIWCACHNGHFDLNGINVGGPPPRPLEPYVVNPRGDQIVVSKAS